MRLIVDARMLGYSGIGTYIAQVLPRVIRRCAALKPIIVVRPDGLPAARRDFPDNDVVTWSAEPLTLSELSRPPIPRGESLWWAPHFNVPLRCRTPLVVTLHDLLPLVDARTNPLATMAVRLWVSRIRSRALRVICDSEFTKNHAIGLGRIDPEKAAVVPLGVQPAPCSHSGSPAPYLLFVGTVKPHKNLTRLLRAFERISSRIPHRLVVVGRHRTLRHADATAIAKIRELGTRIELLEEVSSERLWALLCGAELLVQPSLFEGFGLPPLEAMAAGTPVLASRAGALPEVCGNAAWYCDPESEDDIAARTLELIGNPALRARLAAAGRDRAARFSWDRCAASTADILCESAARATRLAAP